MEEAKSTLIHLQSVPMDERCLRVIELNYAFTVYWASNPSEEDFVKHMSNNILTARILYIMTMTRP